MNIEVIMEKDGWFKREWENGGKHYIEFLKNGLIINLDDIDEEEEVNLE